MAGFKREDVQDMYFLTPMQEGMLFHALADQSAAYFEQVTFELHGSLNRQAFQAAWDRLHQQYAIFRTLFIYDKVKRPMQVVLKKYSSTIAFHDFSDTPHAAATSPPGSSAVGIASACSSRKAPTRDASPD